MLNFDINLFEREGGRERERREGEGGREREGEGGIGQ